MPWRATLCLLPTTLLLAACSSDGTIVQAPDGSRDDSGLEPADGQASATDSADAGSDVAAERDSEAGDAQPSDADAGDSSAPVVIGQSLSGSMAGAASSDGSAMLVVAASGPTLWWSHYEPASGWSSPLELAIPATPTSSLHPQLGMDSSGDAFLAWAYGEDTDGTVVTVAAVTRYDHATGTWGPVENPMPSAVTSDPLSLAVNAQGEALVLPLIVAAGGLFAAHFAGGQWSSESIGPSLSLGYAPPSLSFTDDGLAAALTATGGVATRSAAGTWTVQQPTCLNAQAYLGVAIDASGDLLLPFVWEDIDMHFDLGACYDGAAATWSSTGFGYVIGPSPIFLTAVSPSGDGVVFAGPGAFPYTKSTNTLGAPSGPSGPNPTSEPAYAMASSGIGLAVYGVSVNGVGALQAAGYTIGQGWGAPSPTFAVAAPQQMLPFVSSNGRAWVAWTDGTTTFVNKVL